MISKMKLFVTLLSTALALAAAPALSLAASMNHNETLVRDRARQAR